MRQTSSFTHGVSPCLYPVFKCWSYIVHRLQRHRRRVSITTIPCTFQMWTIYHISTKSQTFHSILNHIMDIIQVSIRTFKSSSLFVISINLQRFHSTCFRFLRKIGDAHVSESVMIEFISEVLSLLTTRYIDITFTLLVKFTVFRQIITIFHNNFMTRRQYRHLHLKPSGLNLPHIYQPETFTQLLYRHSLQNLMYLVYLTHLRGSDMIGNIHFHNRSPFHFV